MRVLLVSNLYPPYWIGGYEQTAEWVATGLRQRGHVVEVLTGRGPALQDRDGLSPRLDLDLDALCSMAVADGIAFPSGLREAFRRHVFSVVNYRACLEALDRFLPDLVSFWNPSFITFSPLVAARRRGVPALAHLTDVAANPFRNPHAPGFPGPLRGGARQAVDLLLRLSRPRVVVLPSAFLRDKLARTERLPGCRIEVLPWPVEPTIGRAVPPERSPAAWTRLLFVGSLIPEKGPDVLLAAFRAALRERPQLTLTFVGTGPAAFVAKLRAQAAGLPVRFAGRLERAAVIEAYRSHDVLVFPSVWEEPYALVPLEAMAMGLAVVASRAGGTPEAVVHGERGLLVPPGDAGALQGAILRLTSEPALAHSLAAGGHEWARGSQGFETSMTRLEQVYAAAAQAAEAAT